MKYVIRWREYSPLAVVNSMFPGTYEIGEAVQFVMEYRQFFSAKGRNIDYWIEPA